MKKPTKSRAYLGFLALTLTLILAGSSSVRADNDHYYHSNYRHDSHGYWDGHHGYHHYNTYNNHHGYWGYQNGFRVFFVFD